MHVQLYEASTQADSSSSQSVDNPIALISSSYLCHTFHSQVVKCISIAVMSNILSQRSFSWHPETSNTSEVKEPVWQLSTEDSDTAAKHKQCAALMQRIALINPKANWLVYKCVGISQALWKNVPKKTFCISNNHHKVFIFSLNVLNMTGQK